MATIALYSSKVNQMSGLLKETKKSVGDLKSELLSFKSKVMAVNKNICDLDDVINTIQASTNIQEDKMNSLEQVKDSIEQFIEDTDVIDGKVADLVNERKDDFYEQYNYLKPECEKSNWEKFCDDLEDIGEWCKDHWKEILEVVAIIAIAIVAVATGGIAALLPLLATALKGALIGAAIGGILGGISSMLQGGSFFEGFLKGAIEGAISGALFGAIGSAGYLLGHSCEVLKKLGQFAKIIPKIAKISGITSLTMAGFDMLSLAVSVFDPKNPLVKFNQKLHKNGLYNAFQFSVSMVAVFTGGFMKGMKNPVCFVAGTMVLTATGLRAIETIKTGDKVIATNPETHKTEEKTVVETYINRTDCIVHISIKDEVINTTKNHPFYVKKRGFVLACGLSSGDEILNISGGYYPVESIELEDKQETVYNFQVEDYHTYYVGDNSLLVHNDCPDGSRSSDNQPKDKPYSNLKDSKKVGPNKKFTSTQKKNIIEQNLKKNGGVIKSDKSGDVLVPATKSQKGVVPNPAEVQVDHIYPRSKGGSNSYSNAQVLSRAENIAKSNK